MINSKKGAMEMSIGTIVTIVLSVTMLIMGVVLIKNIFEGAQNMSDMSFKKLNSQLDKLYSDGENVVIYPQETVIIKQGAIGGVGVGIRNEESSQEFSYVVNATDVGSCNGMNLEQANKLIEIGKSGSNIMVPVGGTTSKKIILKIPLGTPLCLIRYTVQVRLANNEAYESKDFDIQIKAK